MKKKVFYLCLFFVFLSYTVCVCQPFGYQLKNRDAHKIEIPFEYENNFIILEVRLNRTFPLKFIFDTGAEHTILTKREISDLLRLPYERQFTILGSDMQTELYAYLVRSVHLELENISVANKPILVLEEDYFRFEEFTGVDVHGIIGADLFRGFVVKINYQRKMITLYNPNRYKPEHRFEEIPVEFSKNKPYIKASSQFLNSDVSDLKLLIDSGASISIVLHTNTDSTLHMPPNVIKGNVGKGLGGYLEGYLGRIYQFDVGSYSFSNVVVNFQDIPTEMDTTHLNGRNGLIGNGILNRFTIVIDYVKGKMYLRPNSSYKDKFKFDKSGIILIASGFNLSSFTVHDVVQGSPAEEAGIQKGDEIKRVNGFPSTFFSLEDISRIFSKREGKKRKR